MKHHKKLPFSEDYKMSKLTIEDSGSITDCTGLTPTPPLNEEERESYSQIKNFFPDDILIDKNNL